MKSGQCRPDLTVRLQWFESMLQTVVYQAVGMNWMNEGSLVSCTMRKVAFSGVDVGRRAVELTSGTLHFRRMLEGSSLPRI